MTGALIILAVTVIAGILLYTWHRMTTKPGIDDVVNEPRPEGCLVFSFMETENGKEKEIVRFYITDDANHIPVRLDLNLSFGTAKAYLTGATGLRNPQTSKVK